jgi:hypothetical protein
MIKTTPSSAILVYGTSGGENLTPLRVTEEGSVILDVIQVRANYLELTNESVIPDSEEFTHVVFPEVEQTADGWIDVGPFIRFSMLAVGLRYDTATFQDPRPVDFERPDEMPEPEDPPLPEPPVEVPDFTAATVEEFLDALDAAEDGDVIAVQGAITLTSSSINTAALVINKEISIVGDGILQSANDTTAPITFINVTANNVFFGPDLTIKHRRPTVSAGQIDTAISVNAENFVSEANVEFMEFGYMLRGTFDISGTTKYTGPLGNSHRHIGIYSMTGDSTIHDVTFDFPFETTARDIFLFSNQSQAGSFFDGKLTVQNITQANVSTSFSDAAQYYYAHQFFVQEAFAAVGNRNNMALKFDNCFWDDIAGGIFVFNTTDAPLDAYQSIEITNCTQGLGTVIDSFRLAPIGDETSPLRHKGMFFIDRSSGTATTGNPSVLTLSGNTVPRDGLNLRATYTYFVAPGQQTSVAAFNADRYSL